MLKIRTAFRYLFSKSNGNRLNSIFIILGIAFCLCCMIIILSVMDSLQLIQIERIRKIKSFDITVNSEVLNKKDIENIDYVDKVFEFHDFNVVFSNPINGKSLTGVLRAVEENAYAENSYIHMNSFNGLNISTQIRNILALNDDAEVRLTMLKKGKTKIFTPYNREFKVSGYYKSDLNEFNSGYCLIPFDSLKDSIPNNEINLGIFVTSDRNIERIKDKIHSLDPAASVLDWRENNSTIYSALKLEKSVVTLIMVIVFCIVLFNLKNSSERMIKSKLKEAGIFRAMGMQKSDVNSIFFLYGLIMTIIGVISGICFSYLIVNNIGKIMLLFGQYEFTVLLPVIKISSENLFSMITIIMFLSLIFIFASIRKYIKDDVMEVILHASD